ncbi:hypothetical protein AAMO2058_000718300 [Amorphochlora amoebiformis]
MADHLEQVILKRKADISYLRRVHEGNVHWMNIAKLTKEQICNRNKDTLKLRCQRWFLLGLSIGRLLEQPNSTVLLQSMMQLIQEFDYYVHYASKSRKFPTFKWYPPTTVSTPGQDKKGSVPSTQTFKTQLHKVGRKVIFTEFLAFSASIELDYCEVVFSLCEVLSLVYNKLLAQIGVPYCHEAILKFDTWIKTNVLIEMAKQLSLVANPIIDTCVAEINANLVSTLEEKKAKRKAEEEKKLKKRKTALKASVKANPADAQDEDATNGNGVPSSAEELPENNSERKAGKIDSTNVPPVSPKSAVDSRGYISTPTDLSAPVEIQVPDAREVSEAQEEDAVVSRQMLRSLSDSPTNEEKYEDSRVDRVITIELIERDKTANEGKESERPEGGGQNLTSLSTSDPLDPASSEAVPGPHDTS